MAKIILVVDDEQNIRDFISVGLSMEGYTVLTAKDGNEGVNMALTASPDLIVMDVTMPVMDGWDALVKLRREAKTKGKPILMLTGMSSIKDVDKAMELGATSYLVKPFDIDRLLRKISLIIDGVADKK